MRNRILSLLLAILVIFSVNTCAFAESKDTKHDNDIKVVLFGAMGIPSNEEALALLQWASYFAMDCIGKENADEQAALDKLRDYGIAGIPKNVSEFHYKGNRFENQHHERCTHRGWSDALYGPDSEDYANWVTIRKPMLVNAFTQVLTSGQRQWWETADFLNLFTSKVDPTVSKQCESLAAIVYYTHILGDHCYNTRVTLPDRIPLVRKHVNESNPDLLSELKNHFAILFNAQTSTNEYMSLINEIDQIREQWANNVGAFDFDIKTDEQYKAYQNEAKKLMSLLKTEVSPLLKNEAFFANVFYSDAESTS